MSINNFLKPVFEKLTDIAKGIKDNKNAKAALCIASVFIIVAAAGTAVLFNKNMSGGAAMPAAGTVEPSSVSGAAAPTDMTVYGALESAENPLTEPFELTRAEVGIGGVKATVRLLMTEGRHITDGEPGPFGKEYYEGNLVAEVFDQSNKLLSVSDLTGCFSQPLVFRSRFDLKAGDYNGDGLPEFTVGQYFSSNYNAFNIFTLSEKGEVIKLQVRNITDGILSSNHDGYYSTGFEKIGAGVFKVSVYDMQKGKYIDKAYKWNGLEFEPDDGTAAADGGKDLEGDGRETVQSVKLKDGSSISSSELVEKLDRKDETLKYVYDNLPNDIRISEVHEGSFTGSKKPELLVIFKLLGLPHAAGLDYSVAAVFEKDTLRWVTQQGFMTDEAQFGLLQDSKKNNYLLYSGTTTYQGHSTCTLQLLSLKDDWKELLPTDNGINSLGNLKFSILEKGIIGVLKPVFEENTVIGWDNKYYMKWNDKTAEFDDFIPDTYKDKAGKAYFKAASVSPDGSYAAVSHEWGFDGISYLLIYDLKHNCLLKKFEIAAMGYGFMWSPDSRRLCVTRTARIWIDAAVIDIGKKSLFSIMDSGIAGFEAFKKYGVDFDYKLNENRPDPYYQPCEWSPDSKKILMSYQWTDSSYNRQGGSFVFDFDRRTVSDITQNKAHSGADNLEPEKPAGFKW
ncbi:hypothetical protein CLHUN_16760 [Ruminiclostridium hungatei]|uniref:Uncharacterized protein n=1 Tax=Ruminiclostridium hungatei TaxID=48256 RepID=A0A1V4SM96_RUMHU|nr:hypothetical protein [Ruminiclostridium hungatei]OPX44377.1 hypothetical protein CLHUN_16760 [Ruminiclostridium hungatei]